MLAADSPTLTLEELAVTSCVYTRDHARDILALHDLFPAFCLQLQRAATVKSMWVPGARSVSDCIQGTMRQR